jgi:alpha-L-rhamnosidase
LKGEGVETWEPRFTYHGFRYVQVEGYPGVPGLDSIDGRVVRSAVAIAGEFECSHALINRVHALVRRTEASNLHGVPTDCPQRDERMGWLNDMAARVEEALYNFDMSRFLAKWTQDIQDTQDQEGAITDTAPFRWGRRPADPVSVIYLLLPWLLYQFYGDRRVLADRYEGMKAWVDYLSSRADQFILPYSYYGDWSPPIAEGLPGSLGSSAVSRNTPGDLISTGFYHYSARLLGQIAVVLGKKADAAAYEALSYEILRAYNRQFWDESVGGYGSNNQACNAFSIYMGLAQGNRRERAAQNLVRDVIEVHHGHLSTGNLCTKYLLESLSEIGRSDVAFTIASQESYPSWGFMLSNGATTLWERWEQLTGGGMNSHNHPMMGSVDSWFYKYLGGIRLDPLEPGFARILIQPHPVNGVEWARASLKTIRGTVRVAWCKKESVFELDAEVPVGSAAKVWLPKPQANANYTLLESGQSASQAKGVNEIDDQGESIVVWVGSGCYRFSIQ